MTEATTLPQQALTHQPAPATAGWGLLRNRDFAFLFAGQAISQIGDSLNKVALLWFVYDLTGSALKMTIIGALQTLPPLLLGPLIGVYLDRLRKKPVMIVVDLLRTLMVMLIPLFHGLGVLNLELLYVLVFLTSVVSTIFGPALASTVPLIVSRSRLTAANALIQSTTNIGLLVGPAMSGIGIALIGAQNVLYVDAATFLFSALCLVPLRVWEQPRPLASSLVLQGVVRDLRAGFRFVFIQQRTILLLMLTATLYNLGASAFVFLLPAFAKELLGANAVELGALWSALGLGTLAATAGLAWIREGDLSNRLQLISGTLALGGVTICLLCLFHTPLVATLLLVVIGGSMSMFTPIVWASLQELTPEHLLGRVFTTFSTGSMSSAMAGMAAFGWAADASGPVASLIGISVVLLLTSGFTAYFSRHALCRDGTANREAAA